MLRDWLRWLRSWCKRRAIKEQYSKLDETVCVSSTVIQVLCFINSDPSILRVVGGLYWLTNNSNTQLSAVTSVDVV